MPSVAKYSSLHSWNERRPLLGVRPAGDVDLATDPPVGRQRARLGRRHDTRQGRKPLQQRAVEAGQVPGGLVALRWQWQAGDQQVIGGEAQVHLAQRHEAPHQESGPHQQRQRQGHFEDHDGVAQAAAAQPTARAFAAVPQRLAQVAARRLQRRHEAEDERRADGGGEREQEHGAVQADDGLRGNRARRDGSHQPLEAGPGEDSAQGRSSQGEQQALDEERAHQAPAARPQRGADGQLLLAGGAPGEQQVAHVGAADEEQQPHRSQHDEECRPELTHDLLRQGLDLDGEALRVVLRVDLRQPAGHDVEVDLGLAHRDPGLQVAEQVPVAGERARRRIERRGGPARDPQLGIAPRKSRRHDADQRACDSVEHEAPAEHPGVAAEAVDPGLVPHHEDGRCGRLVVGGQQHPTQQGGHAEELEGTRGDQQPLETLGPLPGGVEHVVVRAGDHAIEDAALRHVVEVLGADVEGAPAGLRLLGVVDHDRHEPLRVRVGKRLHQHVLDHAE